MIIRHRNNWMKRFFCHFIAEKNYLSYNTLVQKTFLIQIFFPDRYQTKLKNYGNSRGWVWQATAGMDIQGEGGGGVKQKRLRRGYGYILEYRQWRPWGNKTWLKKFQVHFNNLTSNSNGKQLKATSWGLTMTTLFLVTDGKFLSQK